MGKVFLLEKIKENSYKVVKSLPVKNDFINDFQSWLNTYEDLTRDDAIEYLAKFLMMVQINHRNDDRKFIKQIIESAKKALEFVKKNKSQFVTFYEETKL